MKVDLSSMNFCANPAGDNCVRENLTQIVSALTNVAPIASAIMLTGSFSRAEGSIEFDQNGTAKASNDYDIVVIYRGRPALSVRRSLRLRARTIEEHLKIAHLDLIIFSEAELYHHPLSMLRYDLLKAGKVLYGEISHTQIKNLEKLPPFPLEELRNLLINRMVTLLEAHPTVKNGMHLKEKSRQLAKVIFSVIDYKIFLTNRYTPYYRQKLLTDPIDKIPAYLLEWAGFYFQLSEARPNLSLEDAWEQTLKLHLFCLNECIAALNKKGWRGQSSFSLSLKSLTALIQGRASRWKIEQKILAQLEISPENELWAEQANQLINQWYRC